MVTKLLMVLDLIVVLFQFYEHFCAKKCNLCKKLLACAHGFSVTILFIWLPGKTGKKTMVLKVCFIRRVFSVV